MGCSVYLQVVSVAAPTSTLSSGKGPEGSINFVTCHDGFTMNDLVSFNYKHNEANGENNHDGQITTSARITVLKVRQRMTVSSPSGNARSKNFLLTLFISRGVPMLLGGDEFRRTQGGNNNAYCQDNETSWYDWSCLEQHKDIYRFTRGMIAFRSVHPILSKEQFYTDADIHWFGSKRKIAQLG